MYLMYSAQPSEGQSEKSMVLASLEHAQGFVLIFFSMLKCLFRITVEHPQMHCIFGGLFRN
jgi:hypothetical protein